MKIEISNLGLRYAITVILIALVGLFAVIGWTYSMFYHPLYGASALFLIGLSAGVGVAYKEGARVEKNRKV